MVRFNEWFRQHRPEIAAVESRRSKRNGNSQTAGVEEPTRPNLKVGEVEEAPPRGVRSRYLEVVAADLETIASEAEDFYDVLKKRLTPAEGVSILGKLVYVTKGARLASQHLEELAYRSDDGCTPENTSTNSD